MDPTFLRPRALAGIVGLAVAAVAAGAPTATAATFALGPEELVLADDRILQVPGYSAPSLVPWDGDALPDLVVGEGDGTTDGKVRIYANGGTVGAPAFETFVYAQSLGADLVVPGGG